MPSFFRFLTYQNGYIHFVAFGKKYLYCAGRDTWTEDSKRVMGNALCQNEGFSALSTMAFHDPGNRTRIGENELFLSPTEQKNYDACDLVYIVCKEKKSFHH